MIGVINPLFLLVGFRVSVVVVFGTRGTRSKS
jgi:hypothetical protein